MKLKVLFLLSLMSLSNAVYAGYPVNINMANAEEIADGLDGIGISKAQAIIDYRNTSGAFRSIDDLVNVRGIGVKTVEKNRDYVLLNEESVEDSSQVE